MKKFWTAESGRKIALWSIVVCEGHMKSRKRKWNGNWKWKLETEMGTKNAPITGAMLRSSLVHMWDYCCYLTYFILEQGQHSYSCSFISRPTSSFNCLQCVKQIMDSYTGPGYNSPIPNTLPPPLAPLPILANAEILLIQTLISGNVTIGHIYTESAAHWDDSTFEWLQQLRGCVSISVFGFQFPFYFHFAHLGICCQSLHLLKSGGSATPAYVL